VPGLLGLCLCGLLVVPWLGQDFFPDSGQFILHVPDKTGMHIEETERLFDLVENYIRQTIPASEMEKLRNPGGLMPLPESRYDY
jgi:multidrug efflux pump subunit AcrB